MRYVRLLFILPLLALVACDDDGITVNEVPPASLTRVINAAVQPAGAGFTNLDLRFIYRVENLPHFQQMAPRTSSGAGYTRVAPGTRHLRLFPTSTNPDLAQTRLVDNPSFTLAANERQTLLLTREADGTHTVTRIADPATINRAPAGNVAFKVVHGRTGTGPVDVYFIRGATATVPADWATNNDGVIQNVTYQSGSAYVNVPVASGTELYNIRVVEAGTTNILFTLRPNEPGAAATVPTTGPSPGVRIAESVMTVVLTPGATLATAGFLAFDRSLDPQ